MFGWNHMMGWGGWYGGGLFFLLLAGAVIVGLVIWARNANGGVSHGPGAAYDLTPPPTARQAPSEILATRYAKGEIDREEYETRRKDLESASMTPR